MKKTAILTLLMVLLLTACGKAQTSSDSSVSPEGGEVSAKIEAVDMGEPLEGDLLSPVTTENETAGEESIIAAKDALKRENVRLPEFEKMTDKMISDAVYNDDAIRVSMVKDKKYLAPDAEAALKMKFYGGKYGQFIGMRALDERSPDGATEEVVHDPVPDSLEAYEGIRFWLQLEATTENNPAYEVVFFMGALANGDNNTKYRTMYECKVNVPAGYKGYVECPFEQFTNYYNGKKAVSLKTVDYFAVKLTADNGDTAGTEAYVSGFQAYRDIFW